MRWRRKTILKQLYIDDMLCHEPGMFFVLFYLLTHSLQINQKERNLASQNYCSMKSDNIYLNLKKMSAAKENFVKKFLN